MAKIDEIAEMLVNLTIKEANELADLLKEKYGIKPAAGVAAVAMPVAGGEAAPTAAEEKTSFSVFLKSAGNQKLAVVKALKDILGIGLKEAKDIADKGAAPVKENVSKDEAEDIKKKLTECGAEVEVK